MGMTPKLKMVTLNHIHHAISEVTLFTDPKTEQEYQPGQLMKMLLPWYTATHKECHTTCSFLHRIHRTTRSMTR